MVENRKLLRNVILDSAGTIITGKLTLNLAIHEYFIFCKTVLISTSEGDSFTGRILVHSRASFPRLMHSPWHELFFGFLFFLNKT